jgi:hypothetical protein
MELKVHCHIQKSPPLAPILSQMNPVHTFPSEYSKIGYNIILHLRLGLPDVSSLQVCWLKFCIHFSSLPFVPHAKPISSSLIWSPKNNNWRSIQVMKLHARRLFTCVTFCKRLQDHPLSAVARLTVHYIRSCPPYLEAVSSISIFRMLHVVVTSPLSMAV